MLKNHKKIQEEMIDIFYEEKEWSEELKNHLDTCQECAVFWQELHVLQDKLSFLDLPQEMEIDDRLISSAFKKADLFKKSRANLKESMLFLGTAILLLGVESWFIYLGNSMLILKGQLLMTVLAPFALPVLLKFRLAKEGY